MKKIVNCACLGSTYEVCLEKMWFTNIGKQVVQDCNS